MKNQNHIIINNANFDWFAETVQNLDNFKKLIESGMSEENDMPRARIIIGTHDSGEPIYKRIQAKTESELNDRIVQTYIESGRIWEFLPRDGQTKPPTNTLFQPFAVSFMNRFKVGKVKPRYLDEYKKILYGKLIPEFGSRPIEEITTADIQDFMNRFDYDAKSTLKNWLAILKPILRYAVEQGIIQKNPADSMTLSIPSRKRSERTPLTAGQFADVLAQINRMKDSPEKIAAAIIPYTGMRRGEMLGLQWNDIDFKNKVIHIRRSIKHSHNQPILDDTSTKTESGVRDIYLLKDLAAILEPFRGNGYLLGGEAPLTARRYETIRKHIRKMINLHGATEHVLRHTFLTLLSGEGTDPKTLQAYAGHSDSHTTMQIYVHPQAEKIKEAGNTMENLLHNLSQQGANIQGSTA